MPSHFSFTINDSNNGLGQMRVSPEAQQVYDQHLISHPTRLPVRGSGISTITPVFPTRTRQPIVTTSVPATSGSYPILTTDAGGSTQPSNGTKSGSSVFTLDGDHLVIAGDHRIKKTQALMVGAGLAGVAVALKYIL